MYRVRVTPWMHTVAGALSQLAAGLAIYAAACGSLIPSLGYDIVCPVWLPAGVALGLVLRFGIHLLPGIMLGALATALSEGAGPVLALALALVSPGSVLAGAGLIRLVHGGHKLQLDRLEDVLAFAGLGGFFSPLVNATLGTALLFYADIVTGARWPAVWAAWWFGDVAGIFLIAPVFLAWQGKPRLPARICWLEIGAYFAMLTGIAVGLFALPQGHAFRHLVRPLWLFPILLTGAIRYGPQVSALACSYVLSALMVLTVLGIGPFVADSPGETGVALQTAVVVVTLTTAIVAALMAERHHFEQRLMGERNLLQAVLDATPDQVAVQDREGRYLLANRAALEWLQACSQEHVLGKTDAELNVEQFAGKHLPADSAGTSLETRCRAGETYWLQICHFPLGPCASNGQRQLILRRNVTQLVRTQEALRESVDQYRSLVENAPIGIYRTTPDGRILMANPFLVRILGYSSFEELAQKNLEQDWPDPVKPRRLFREQLEAAGEIFGLESTWMRHDGKPLHVRENARVVRDAAGQVLYYEGTIEDITSQKQAEEALERVESQLLQAQKMEAIGRLAGGVAHDFNNLLTAIIGFSDVLATSLPEHSSARELVKEIKRAGEKASVLTRQLLAFSRRQVMIPRVLDLNQTVAELEKLLRRVIGEDIHLYTHLASQPLYIRADPTQIEQVIMNLAVNARDAMPEGGQLFVETAAVHLEEAHACYDAQLAPGQYALLVVRDTGCGMDETVKAHLFEPFFTTKEHGKGTGLGLATVYGIVQQSGGHISVESEPHQGTTFRIYLPLVADDQASSCSRTSLLVESMPRGTETVLLVEDEAGVRNLASQVLRRCGYQVLEARNGSEALHMANEFAGPIHVLLTDVVMPNLNGRQLAEKLLASRPDLRIVYMSGYTDDQNVLQCISRRDAHFLAKPFSPSQLANRIYRALHGTTPHSTRPAPSAQPVADSGPIA